LIARQATLQLTGIWKAKDISTDLQKQLVRSLVLNTALHGTEKKKIDKKSIVRCWYGAGCSKPAGHNGKLTHTFTRRLVHQKKRHILSYLTPQKLS